MAAIRPVRRVAFSPDGRHALTVTSVVVRVWALDAPAPKVAFTVGARGGLNWATFDATGRRLVTGAEDGVARVWSVPGGTEEQALPGHESGARRLALSPDGRTLLVAPGFQAARVWDLRQFLRGREDTLEAQRIGWDGAVTTDVGFAPDGRRLFVGAFGSLQVWSVRDGRATAPVALLHPWREVVSATFSPDGLRLLSGTDDGVGRLWTLEAQTRPVPPPGRDLGVPRSPEPPPRPVLLTGHSGPVRAVAFSPDGARALTASADGTARLWWVHAGAEPRRLAGDGRRVRSIAFQPDGRTLVVTAEEDSLRVWPVGDAARAFAPPDACFVRLRGGVPSAESPETLEGSPAESCKQPLSNLVPSPDGAWVAALVGRDAVGVWPVSGGPARARFEGRGMDDVRQVRFSPDGAHLLTTSDDENVRVWPLDGADPPRTLAFGRSTGAVFRPDGAVVALVGARRDLTLWPWRAGETTTLAITDLANGLTFSPDGARLALFGGARVHVRPTTTAGSAAALTGHTADVVSVAFAPDGDHLLTVTLDGTARVWPLSGDRTPALLTEPTSPVRVAAFHPDGATVATGHLDGSVRIWRLERLDAPVVLAGEGAAVTALAYAPDGRRLAAGAEDGSVRAWTVEIDRLRQGLWVRTRVCPTAAERVALLGLPEAAAVVGAAACEAAVAARL